LSPRAGSDIVLVGIGCRGDIRRRWRRGHLAIGTRRVERNVEVSREFQGVAGYDTDVLCDPGRDALSQPLRTDLASEVGAIQFFAVAVDVLGVLVHRVFGFGY
jgi:hypothetical protein